MFKVKRMKIKKKNFKKIPFGNKSMKGWKQNPHLSTEEVVLLKNNGQ